MQRFVLVLSAVLLSMLPMWTTTSASAVTCNGRTVTTYLGDGSNEIINGNASDNAIHGQGGHDTLGGAAGLDDICGGDGQDTITGDRHWGGYAWLYPAEAGDYIQGGGGCDSLEGEGGPDIVIGGPGHDSHPLYEGCVTENEVGGVGAIWGQGRGDDLDGDDGDDYLEGGDGDDTARGGLGFDRCDMSNEAGFSCEMWI